MLHYTFHKKISSSKFKITYLSIHDTFFLCVIPFSIFLLYFSDVSIHVVIYLLCNSFVPYSTIHAGPFCFGELLIISYFELHIFSLIVRLKFLPIICCLKSIVNNFYLSIQFLLLCYKTYLSPIRLNSNFMPT